MTKQLLLITLLAVRIAYPSFNDHTEQDPFTSNAPGSPVIFSNPEPRFIEVKTSIQHNKIVINWEVTDNQLVDQFEVEKSTDGIHFRIAALVFGTDTDSVDHYQFYEKALNQKVSFRIHLLTKNHASVYSERIEIQPSN